jgi:hypothetical protein
MGGGHRINKISDSNKQQQQEIKNGVTNKFVSPNHTTNFVYIGSLNTDINNLKDQVQTALFKDPVHTTQ